MAYLEKGTLLGSEPIYNVEQPVGATGTNAPGDVKLVQYMLRNIYGASATGLAVDGWIGPKTISWIKQFQGHAKGSGNNILCDGRVDRALGPTSSVSKTTYTIILMNSMLKSHNPTAFAYLPTVVPLSPTPKASPYSMQAKTVAQVRYIGTKKVQVTYSDGSVETIIWEGPFPVGPGVPVYTG